MVELMCSRCGKRERHKDAVKFVQNGWGFCGSADYCRKCSRDLEKDESSLVHSHPRDVTFHLLHMVSMELEVMQHNERVRCKK